MCHLCQAMENGGPTLAEIRIITSQCVGREAASRGPEAVTNDSETLEKLIPADWSGQRAIAALTVLAEQKSVDRVGNDPRHKRMAEGGTVMERCNKCGVPVDNRGFHRMGERLTAPCPRPA